MRVRRCGASILPIALALVSWGCANDAPPRAEERAGQVVQDDNASATPAPQWALEAEPRFSLTGNASDPEFYFVGPLDGVILEDKSTIIRDGGTETLVYLDPEGTTTRIAGGPGEGPGEFQRLSEILPAPGEPGVWAWDSRLRRLSHFDRSGDFLTSFVAPPRTGAPPVAVLPGPSFVTIAESAEGTGAEGVESPRRLYAVRDSQWNVVREFEGPPEPVSPWVRWNESGVTADPDVPASNSGLPEGCLPALGEVVVGNELFAAAAEAGAIHAFAEDGSVHDVYRASRRQQVTPEIRAAVESRFERLFTVSRMDPSASVRRAILREVGNRLGDHLPAWQGVIADPEGRIWLERSKCLDGSDDDVFDVVGIDGQRVGSIAIPVGMNLLAVRGDDVLVSRRGELGVPHVEMYRLVTGPG